MVSTRFVRRFVLVMLALCAVVPAIGQAGAEGASRVSVPAARQADRVVIITMAGGIDQWTERSIKRRIAQAEESGADAIVIEIDSPGGELGAVLEICNAIKGSSIKNTVAWVRPDAYSGGAIVALACGKIVTSSPASMGDAFPINISWQGIRGLTPEERTKYLPPLLTEVSDSARRNGYDEFLVQAMVVDDVELWSVKDAETGRILIINENEYRVLFEGDPPRGKPVLASVTGGRASTKAAARGQGAGVDDDGSAGESAGEEVGAEDSLDEPAGTSDDGVGFTPAGPSIVDLAGPISDGLTSASTRPVFGASDRGKYVEPVYVSDGTGPIVLRDDQLLTYGFTTEIIETDGELTAFFGAQEMTRTAPNWSERMVRLMMNPVVRGILIVVLLIGLFIEMSSPGVVVPGVVAALALGGLLAPPMLVGMAGWWEIAAIGLGIVFLLIELLVIPGFGVFGLVGLVSLFAGMVGTFIPDGTGGLFEAGAAQRGLFNGLATVLLAVATAGIGIFFLTKHYGSIPLLNRLILQDPVPAEEKEGVLLAMRVDDDDVVGIGDVGRAASALRPSGRALVNGEMLDAIAERGLIDDGEPVEIVGRRGFSWVVRKVRAGGAGVGEAENETETDG